MTGTPRNNTPLRKTHPRLDADGPDPETMATAGAGDASLPGGALRRHTPKVGAQCGNPARWDLRGGPPARAVPTATLTTVPVVLDGGIPANLGGGTNETRIIVGDFRDCYLFENSGGSPRSFVSSSHRALASELC
jgi:hypothetical protein